MKRDQRLLAAARRTLDLAKAGGDVPEWAIKSALITTGDLPQVGDEGDERDLHPARVHRVVGDWEQGAGGLLAPATWCGL